MKLDSQAPDGKPWREDALHILGAHLVRWHPGDSGPEIEPDDINLARYAEAVSEADGNAAAVATHQNRRERNARLASSDWTQLPDVKLSKDQAAAWKAYRQALRDLPLEGKPAWPKPPEA